VTNGVVVVAVRGEVDLVTVGTLRDSLSSHATDPRTRLLVCDLTQVGFLACSGLSALLDTRAAMEARSARFAVVASTPAVLRPVAVTGLRERIPVLPTLAAVLRQSFVE
jgi:anti-sigma B factor antagonist